MNSKLNEKQTNDEQKFLNLKNDNDFKNQISEIENDTSKNSRIEKIKNILSEKGIEYTQQDAELFENIINYAQNKNSKLNLNNLEKISGGVKSDMVIDSKEFITNTNSDVSPCKIKLFAELAGYNSI